MNSMSKLGHRNAHSSTRCRSSVFDIPAASEFRLGNTPGKPETDAASPTRTPVISKHLGHVFREQKMTGKAGWQNATDLNNAMLSCGNGLEGERISHDHIAKHRSMFVTGRAIRIDDSHTLHHAVEIDNVVRGTPE